MAAGELVRCDTARLARVIGALESGSRLTWSIRREGSVAKWLRRDLETVLMPLRSAKAARPHGDGVARAPAKQAKRPVR